MGSEMCIRDSYKADRREGGGIFRHADGRAQVAHFSEDVPKGEFVVWGAHVLPFGRSEVHLVMNGVAFEHERRGKGKDENTSGGDRERRLRTRPAWRRALQNRHPEEPVFLSADSLARIDPSGSRAYERLS